MHRKSVRGGVAALLLSFALLASAPPVRAAAPEAKFPVTFTTTLASGALLPFTFTLWDARTGGTQVAGWVEGPVKLRVASDKTVYFVLGSKVPLPALDFTQQYWVEIATGLKKYRTRLPAAAYAQWSEGVNTDPLDARYVEEGQEGAVTNAMIGQGQVTAAKVGSESAADGQVLAADGAGGASWQTLAGLPPAAHQHAGGDITSGTVGEARVDAAIARDAEIVPAVLAADGPGSGLDADLLDGSHAAAFAATGHGHASAYAPVAHAHDAGYWKLDGNAGTTAGTSFIGTTDNQAIEVKVNGSRALRVEPHAASPNLVAGSAGNAVTAGVDGAFIGGGGAAMYDCGFGGAAPCPNSVTDSFGVVAGGGYNQAGNAAGTVTDAQFATVGGGSRNEASAGWATVGGGLNNAATWPNALVAGGGGGRATYSYATVGGGNTNHATNYASTVIGGQVNVASGQYSAVLGGLANHAGGDASVAAGNNARVRNAEQAGVPGGDQGTFVWSDTSGADVFTSTGPGQFLIRAAGGVGINRNNPTTALDVNGVVTALALNVDGTASTDRLTVVETASFGASTGMKLNLHSAGYNVGIQGNSMYHRVDSGTGTGGFAWYRGGTHSDAAFDSGGGTTLMTLDRAGNLVTRGTVNGYSDRNVKEGFAPVEPVEVLAKVASLPIQTWKYRADEAPIRHMGPMAQDFRAAFGLGAGETTIAMVDADGVALAAIQGLDAIAKEHRVALEALRNALAAERAANEAQRAEIAELRSQVAAQALLVERLLAASGRGGERTAVQPASAAH